MSGTRNRETVREEIGLSAFRRGVIIPRSDTLGLSAWTSARTRKVWNDRKPKTEWPDPLGRYPIDDPRDLVPAQWSAVVRVLAWLPANGKSHAEFHEDSHWG
jgi:hypothetical protein